ncbi:hypothetical protein SAMN05660841_04277 [Sphingobacterium nematocida]|uniref:Uncharacterized protein n=1 Tax=Sphingobacterium nematocida TaxID=1513896 RepID=A0A1T5GQP3_9SPHI|nr:hypothetical protein [Sphingobacterium nematocida]SKC10707.1 hypothetical protein SAMN05660841_04277 [Sphingobacterium nematocida]
MIYAQEESLSEISINKIDEFESMTAVVIYHPSGIAEAGRHSALRIASAAMGHPSWGQTYPMLCLGGRDRSYWYRPLFKRIRRRFAVFPVRR